MPRSVRFHVPPLFRLRRSLHQAFLASRAPRIDGLTDAMAHFPQRRIVERWTMSPLDGTIKAAWYASVIASDSHAPESAQTAAHGRPATACRHPSQSCSTDHRLHTPRPIEKWKARLTRSQFSLLLFPTPVSPYSLTLVTPPSPPFFSSSCLLPALFPPPLCFFLSRSHPTRQTPNRPIDRHMSTSPPSKRAAGQARGHNNKED